jgi:transcriptional regulator with PAS, ATPase and Fis domain
VPTDLTLQERLAWDELTAIEKALRDTNGKKDDAAHLLRFNSSDNIYTRIKKHQKDTPDLVAQFPLIGRYYKTLLH